MLMKGSSKRKRTKAKLEEVKEEEALRSDIQGYLMDVKRLKQEHGGDGGLPAERAEPAPGAAADGQPAQQWGPDDAVQHLIEKMVS